ncbi:MAG: NDP-hexose 2,3-dehydratase family protein [Vicinamibacterales bacterium]|nr:NDP-hexose 2,3-dehydratase family protein [Vicinamibacterales bacterium]
MHALDRIADASLRSAVLADGPGASLKAVEDWLEAQRAAQAMTVRRVPLAAMEGWSLGGDPRALTHESGRFFSVEGVHVETDIGPVHAWDQPIIRQPEIGILGIVTRVVGGVRRFLMQAKVEPGNVNGVQLSPTVQATRSNYTRVHGGERPPYLEYFLDPARARVLVDQLQGEQGSRYLRKQNRNMIVEIDDDLPAEGRFCWMTLAQIKQLLKRPNLVNMDTRTVLACLPLLGRGPLVPGETEDDSPPLLIGDLPLGAFARELLASVLDHHRPASPMHELLHWLTDLRARHTMTVAPRPLDALAQWVADEMSVHHASGRYFSVVAVAVESGVREVRRWQQPLIAHAGHGLNGFLLQRINGVLHFLVRASAYPGNVSLFELGSTVSRSGAGEYFSRPDAPPFLDLFRDPPPAWVRYDAVQSEEGGRFYQYQNRYMILELPEGLPVAGSPIHRWMTLGQIQDLLVHGYFNIEGRNLLACLDLCDGVPS